MDSNKQPNFNLKLPLISIKELKNRAKLALQGDTEQELPHSLKIHWIVPYATFLMAQTFPNRSDVEPQAFVQWVSHLGSKLVENKESQTDQTILNTLGHSKSGSKNAVSGDIQRFETALFTPIHEQMLAYLMGFMVKDGIFPFVSYGFESIYAQNNAIDNKFAGNRRSVGFGGEKYKYFARITPCYLQVGMQDVVLKNKEDLVLTEQEILQFEEILKPLFKIEGYDLHATTTNDWVLSALGVHEHLQHLTGLSFDAAVGKDVSCLFRSLKQNADAPTIKALTHMQQLQTQVQMLLYTHPLNEARTARGLLPVNAFWVDQIGAYDATKEAGQAINTLTEIAVVADFIEAFQRMDLNAWVDAWCGLQEAVQCMCMSSQEKGRSFYNAKGVSKCQENFKISLCGAQGVITVDGAVLLGKRVEKYHKYNKYKSLYIKFYDNIRTYSLNFFKTIRQVFSFTAGRKVESKRPTVHAKQPLSNSPIVQLIQQLLEL